MGNLNRATDKRWGLPAGLIALLLGLVLFGGLSGPTPAYAKAILCGQCHSIPPQSSDNGNIKDTTARHFEHVTSVGTSPNYNTTSCGRCHTVPPTAAPTATHINTLNRTVNINSSDGAAPGLSYNRATKNCTNACHSNRNDAFWTYTSHLTCNSCHYRSGLPGNYTQMLEFGLHRRAFGTVSSFGHFSSIINVGDNTQTVTCNNCHPDNSADVNLTHAKASTFQGRADMNPTDVFQNVTVIDVGYTKGYSHDSGTCTSACHNNSANPVGFANMTVYYKPGDKIVFGGYSAPKWSDTTLRCNACHSVPSQQATFSNTTSGVFGTYTTAASKNADAHHLAHMFVYKLNSTNFPNQDRNIYCSDCHKLPNVTAVRGFKNHSTYGQNGSGLISLPVKSQNARVVFRRNSGIGRDGINPASFTGTVASCTNIYCHSAISPTAKAQWSGQACNSCHGTKNGVEAGSGAPGYRDWTTPSTYSAFEDYTGGGGAHYMHVEKLGYSCRTCHYRGGVDNPANHHKTTTVVLRQNVTVNVEPKWWFKNNSSVYNKANRTCSNVRCHYGTSKNWDCSPAH